jgi:hypothetical protein
VPAGSTPDKVIAQLKTSPLIVSAERNPIAHLTGLRMTQPFATSGVCRRPPPAISASTCRMPCRSAPAPALWSPWSIPGAPMRTTGPTISTRT